MVSYRTVLLFCQAPSDHHHHHHQEKPRRSTTSNHLMETISPDCSCKTYNYHYITGSKSAWLATERVARVPLCCQFPGFLHHQCTVQNPEQGKMFFNCSRVSSVTPPDLRMRLPEHDKSAFSPGSGYFHSSGAFCLVPLIHRRKPESHCSFSVFRERLREWAPANCAQAVFSQCTLIQSSGNHGLCKKLTLSTNSISKERVYGRMRIPKTWMKFNAGELWQVCSADLMHSTC